MTDAKKEVEVPGGVPPALGGERFGVFAEADVRNADLTFATGDCVGYLAALGTPAPLGFERLDRAVFKCLGWLDTTGYTFKNTELPRTSARPVPFLRSVPSSLVA